MSVQILRKGIYKVVAIGDNGTGYYVYKFEYAQSELRGVMDPTPHFQQTLTPLLDSGFVLSEYKMLGHDEDRALYEFFNEMSGWKLPEELPAKKIHFMQPYAGNETKEYTVLGNAAALENGKLSVHSLPKIRVWLSSLGKIWTLDHRRLAAFRLAKVELVPVVWADAGTAYANRFKMDQNHDAGHSIHIRLGGGKTLLIT